jgi:nucleotide-binding universal stress UspA family protein
MFKKILVALDRSPLAEKALDHLASLVKTIDADIRLVNVAPPGARDVKEMQAYLDAVALRMADRLPSVDSVILRGEVAHKLIAHAITEKYDLIALTTHGRSGIDRIIYGSVAEELLKSSPIPLFLVRASATPARFRSILVPLDGSERSGSILPLAGDFALAAGARVQLLTVRPGTKLAQTVTDSLIQAQETMKERGLESKLVVRHGDAAEEILAMAGKSGADLIAISTHGRTGAERRRFGSVTEAVLHRCTVPLLVQRTAGGKARRPLILQNPRKIEQFAQGSEGV